MTRYLSGFCLVIVITVCAWPCYSQGTMVTMQEDPPAAKVWKEFSSSEGGFSVQLPGTPVSKAAPTANGKTTIHSFTLELKDSFYLLSYLDFPDGDDPALAAKRLDTARDGMFAKNKSTKMLSERELKLGSFTGREFLVLQDQSALGIFRAYIVRNRLYEIALLAPTDVVFGKKPVSTREEDRSERFNTNAYKFLESLEIPAATATMDEIELKLRELRRLDRYRGVQTVVCTSCDSKEPTTQAPSSEGGPVLNGKALKLVTPAYPAIARSAHAPGEVRVHVLIDLDGNVAAAEIVDGHPLLRAAALQAARASKFTPTQLEGKTVMVSGIIIDNFRAQ